MFSSSIFRAQNNPSAIEALSGVLGIRDNWQNNFRDTGYLTK